MLTLLLATLIGSAAALIGFLIYPSYILAAIMFVLAFVAFNFFMGRRFMAKLTDIFNSCEKDLKNGKMDAAIEKLKKGYQYSKWQFMVDRQIDSQIGIILYASKKFDEALPYLKKTLKNNWMAMSMLAAYYFRTKDYKQACKIMADAAKANQKDSFTQVFYAYILSESGDTQAAVLALSKALKKMPTDERVEHALDALKNNKKIKMQAYGALWMQLHLMKSQDGVKQYQTLIGRQKITRR